MHRIDFDLREDETSAWVPFELLTEAVPGDRVIVDSSHLRAPRVGTVVETVDDAVRGRFHRVAFEAAG
jgi:hypothetical protein